MFIRSPKTGKEIKMNGPDVLAIARHQLTELTSLHAPPPLSPLNVSPWVAMSALQKGIRRSDQVTALRAAATLLISAPERLWRRCGVIAFEDIGLADPNAVSIVTASLAGKRF